MIRQAERERERDVEPAASTAASTAAPAELAAQRAAQPAPMAVEEPASLRDAERESTASGSASSRDEKSKRTWLGLIWFVLCLPFVLVGHLILAATLFWIEDFLSPARWGRYFITRALGACLNDPEWAKELIESNLGLCVGVPFQRLVVLAKKLAGKEHIGWYVLAVLLFVIFFGSILWGVFEIVKALADQVARVACGFTQLDGLNWIWPYIAVSSELMWFFIMLPFELIAAKAREGATVPEVTAPVDQVRVEPPPEVPPAPANDLEAEAVRVSEAYAALIGRVVQSGASDDAVEERLAAEAREAEAREALLREAEAREALREAGAREALREAAARAAEAARAADERRAAEAREAEARAAHEAAATAAAANEGTARAAPKWTPRRNQANVLRRVEGDPAGENPARALVYRTPEGGEVVVKNEPVEQP